MKPYCTQNNGDCSTCSLVNYNRDCYNKPVQRKAAPLVGKMFRLPPDVNATLERIAAATGKAQAHILIEALKLYFNENGYGEEE